MVDQAGYGTLDVGGGATIRYRLDGAGEAPWLVFSNSLMTDLRLWDGQAERFSRDYRILRYDQRGHGGSSVPDAPCSFPQLVDDLLVVFDHLGIARANLVGVSMGGVTALGFAGRHPERVDRVAICDCSPRSSVAGATAWDERIAGARAGGMAALVEPTMARWFTPGSLAGGDPGLGRVRRMIADTPLDGFERAARALQDYDFSAELAAIRCPAALIVGAADAPVPAMRAMADAMPSAHLTEIADAGHLPNVERPAAFDEALSALLARPAILLQG